MILKKPYAFFIKYFRIINLLISVLLIVLGYKLNVIRNLINDIYAGSLTNFSNLNSTYIGFSMYLLLFIIIILLVFIIILFIKKKKPLKDYLFSLIYIVFCFAYLFSIGSLFLTLEKVIVEQSDLKVYCDISFLIMIPIVYFVSKFVLISIGFNLKKFNFSSDILEMKKEEKDNEEVEINFTKNTYKYKRFLRKNLRELKYYFLENRIIIIIILSAISILSCVSIMSINIFDSNKISLNEKFVVQGLTYSVKYGYETNKDLNNNIIKEGYKFVIVGVDIYNGSKEAKTIDFSNIRLLFKNNYSYANNNYNKYFLDFGVPYNNDIIKQGSEKSFIFVVRIPETYNKNSYLLKIYNGIVYSEDGGDGDYKQIKINTNNIENKRIIKNISLKENVYLNKEKYGNSNVTISSFEFDYSFINKTNNKIEVIRDQDLNKQVLILDYKLDIDKNSSLANYFINDIDFFDSFITITYYVNGNVKKDKANILACVDNKVILSVPLKVKDSSKVEFNIELRDAILTYKLK